MPVKTVQVYDSFGLANDVPPQFLVDGAFTDLRNFRFNQYGAESLAGDRIVFSESILDNPFWLSPFPPLHNPVWVYASLFKLFTVQGTTHVEITRTSGGNYAGVAGERWNSCVLAGYGFFNNTIDPPQSWANFQPGTPVTNLANWTAGRRCKALRSFKNFLIALYMVDSGVEKPYRILWSHPATPGTVPPSWDSGDPAVDSREIDLSETKDYLVDCLPLGDTNIVYKEQTTWAMRYIGPPFHFHFSKLLGSRGLLHRDCVAAYPKGHCVVTQDDLIVHNGQIESGQSIVKKRMRKWLFSSIDPTNYKNSFVFSYPSKNEVWFCFPELGAEFATLAVLWNYEDNSIGIRELPGMPFISVGPIGDSLVSDMIWDSIV